jgi:hypothetical protein
MLVICAGMFRSGSTWQYQVACDLLERHGGVNALGYVYGLDIAPLADRGEGRHVFKFHDTNPICTEWLADGRARCLYSYRDMRDAAFSMAHKQSQTLRETVFTNGFCQRAIASDAFWRSQKNVFVQRYETWMENPVPMVEGIAKHLDVELAPGEAEEVAAKFSLDANRERTEKLADRLRNQGVDLSDPSNTNYCDPKEQLHWNHLRTGTVGDWRQRATTEDVVLLARECGAWLAENGYESDPLWAALNHEASELKAARAELEILRPALAQSQAAHAAAAALSDAFWADAADARAHYEDAKRKLDTSPFCLPFRIARTTHRMVQKLHG